MKYYALHWPHGQGTTYANSGDPVVDVHSYPNREMRNNSDHIPVLSSTPIVRAAKRNNEIFEHFAVTETHASLIEYLRPLLKPMRNDFEKQLSWTANEILAAADSGETYEVNGYETVDGNPLPIDILA